MEAYSNVFQKNLFVKSYFFQLVISLRKSISILQYIVPFFVTLHTVYVFCKVEYVRPSYRWVIEMITHTWILYAHFLHFTLS